MFSGILRRNLSEDVLDPRRRKCRVDKQQSRRVFPRKAWCFRNEAWLMLALVSVATLQYAFKGTWAGPRSFSFKNFHNVHRLVLIGAARQIGRKQLQLTGTLPDESGLVAFHQPVQLLSWEDRQECVSGTFSTSFSFQREEGLAHGDGLTFLLLPSLESPGWAGGYLGFGLPAPFSSREGLAVEFDAYQSTDFGDMNGNHVGLNILRNMRSIATSDLTPILKLQDGQVKHVWLEYNSTSGITVYLSNHPEKPALPVLHEMIDLCTIFSQPFVYVGFSASTGGTSGQHLMHRWSWHSSMSDSAGPGVAIKRSSGSARGGASGKILQLGIADLQCSPAERRSHSKNFRLGGSVRPKFVAVSQIVEQLSKAKIHLAEIMAFVKVSGRTLVLPNCGSSHLGAGFARSLPLCSYFDTERIGEYIPWVSEDYFLELFERSYERPHKLVHLHLITKIWKCKHCIQTEVGDGCVDLPALSSERRAELLAHTFSRGQVDGTGPLLCSYHEDGETSLQVLEKVASEDVIVLTKRFWGSSFVDLHTEKQVALAYLRYAPYLRKAVQRLITGPLKSRYVAAHWRVEVSMAAHLTGAQIQECMDGLLARKHQVMDLKRLAATFVASDFGMRSNGTIFSKSDTVQAFRLPHEIEMTKQQMRVFFEHLGAVTWDVLIPDYSSLDIGVQGILDKLVCGWADEFLYGPPQCYARSPEGTPPLPGGGSSFTLEILQYRKELNKPEGTDNSWANDTSTNNGATTT